MNIFDFLSHCGFINWFCTFSGILLFQFVRAFPIKKTYSTSWAYRNMIPLIWSLFWLSLSCAVLFTYLENFPLISAFILGYLGTHFIFRLSKPVFVRPVSKGKPTRYNLPKV
ncbi:MAG: hypothetical protein MUC87_20835 [Bacteroidia bacterium]|jgi:hypothetical protein|nr:hypothetical protein [Bacteroidia bacterium]